MKAEVSHPSTASSGPLSALGPRDRWALATCVLLALTLGMFADLLFTATTFVSDISTDIRSQFVAWREFGFGQLRQGNLALWNPHLFSGTPYFSGFQSALLYPPNWLHLVLPVATAINWLVALHVFLAGLFMYLWTSHRGLHPVAGLVSAGIFMFCGAHFLHVYAGHLPNLSAIPWVPLVFLAIDGMIEVPSMGWCFLGIFAISMQILAGHPQYVFFTAVAGSLYVLLNLVNARRRWLALAGLAAMVAGAAALTAVQVFPGAAASAESVRGGKPPFYFVAMFSLPPENFLTLLAPGFFGDMVHLTYWGRYYLWEMSVFVGVTGLFLAVCGAVRGQPTLRRFSLPMVLVLLLLALGAHTPLLRFLYDWVPGFDKFRGNAKFVLPASVFIAMLSGVGLDLLLRKPRLSLKVPVAVAAVGLFIGAGALVLRSHIPVETGWWQRIMQAIPATHETYRSSEAYSDAQCVDYARQFASFSLLVAAGTLLLLAGLLFAARSFKAAIYLVAVLAVAELFVFARISRATFPFSETRMPVIQQFLAHNPGDYRILNLASPNAAMSMGAADIWGYDPGVSLRYAQLMTFLQGGDPNFATQYVKFKSFHPLMGMLRLRYGIVLTPEGFRTKDSPSFLPRLLLVSDYRVMTGRDQIFAAMSHDFDPRAEVILEQTPDPEPVKSSRKGSARIVSESTDWMNIEADTESPSILVVTDGYWTGWRARSLDGKAQSRYQVMPANYVLRAIPLAAGHHLIRLEYAPGPYLVGRYVSAGTAIVLVGGLLLYMRRLGPGRDRLRCSPAHIAKRKPLSG